MDWTALGLVLGFGGFALSVGRGVVDVFWDRARLVSAGLGQLG